MKKYLKIIIPLILICITGLVIYHFVSKVKLNSSYVNGNTAGNLYNAGLFCESDGEVFFSNTNDNGRLYAIDADHLNTFPVTFPKPACSVEKVACTD